MNCVSFQVTFLIASFLACKPLLAQDRIQKQYYDPAVHTEKDVRYTRQIPRKHLTVTQFEKYEQLLIFDSLMADIGLLNYNESCLPALNEWKKRPLDTLFTTHTRSGWFRNVCNWFKFLSCEDSEGQGSTCQCASESEYDIKFLYDDKKGACVAADEHMCNGVYIPVKKWPSQDFELLVKVDCMSGSTCVPSRNKVYPQFISSFCQNVTMKEQLPVKEDEDPFYKNWLTRSGKESKPIGVHIHPLHEHDKEL